MWTCLSVLCLWWVIAVRGRFHGICPRKEPPPGVVVVSPGSDVVLTCRGHVIMDGVKVASNTNKKLRSYFDAVTHPTENSASGNTVLQIKLNQKSEEHNTVPTSSPKSEWDATHVEFEGEHNEEEGEVRGVKSRSQWKFNSKDLPANTQGTTLSLSNVRMRDSGHYSCYHGGTEQLSTRVVVAEGPETPHLSCYKKSPSSKIRCEWTPQKPVTKGTSCSLVIHKSLTGPFIRLPCSYSTRRSCCWCALDHNEEDKRTPHQAFLCVTSIAGNTTSDVIYFTPMQILKPDPPYNVSVQPETGLTRTLTVTWKPPQTWKFKDRFYDLIYEIRYKPLLSTNFQTKAINEQTKDTITDAEAGAEYEVQVRAKDEYEGDWSEWSEPAYGRSWTDSSSEDLFATPFPYTYNEGSGAEDSTEDISASVSLPQDVSLHFLWIAVSFGVLLAILAVFIFRRKDKCVSKLQSLIMVGQCSDMIHPLPTSTVAEGHALSNNAPPVFDNDRPLNEQELRAEERIDAIIFNNTSYFLVQKGS